MSGHSKWAQIKRKKATTDAKRGKIFSKIVKEISVAARIGGSDPNGNARLRTAIEKAKEANMPVENVKKAIQKGAGELAGVAYKEAMYEGYGPGGAAILIETMSDNKNRTVADVRYILSKNNGSMGEAGCVSWMFEKKGYILIDKAAADEDKLMSIIIEAGADDLKNDPKETQFEVFTSPENFEAVKQAIRKEGINIASNEISMIPKNLITLENKYVEQTIRIIEMLEDNDDVQNVYTNLEIPEEMMFDM
ncbi:transcriptional regulator [Candidatus Magnetoovum chiemensis]|nr:transcriptional regulator [Candidatus Magnetoovum chiemensis]